MKDSNNQAPESPYCDRETLYQEVWEEPMIHVAKRYGVSDVALQFELDRQKRSTAVVVKQPKAPQNVDIYR